MGDVQGTCDDAFGAVREAFAANFSDGLELGASLSISIGGRNVVDLWGGFADLARTRPWEGDTLVCVFSCTKGLVAMATMWAAERGMVDIDRPVADYWPEFAAAGKDDIPVRWLLTHEAGLSKIDEQLPFGSLSDWDLMTAALAAQRPAWTPGSGHGYHGVTFGHLVGEVLRRATGRRVGEIIRTELAEPLGVEAWMPVPDHVDARLAELEVDIAPEGPFFSHWGRDSLGPASFGNPPDCNDPAHCMSTAFRRAEIPAANLHSNARGLDRLYSLLALGGSAHGVELCSAARVAEAARVHVEGSDRVMELPTAFGLGFEHTIPEWPFGPAAHTYGHNGSGGSLGLVDPDAQVSFGYAMNRLHWGPHRSDPRWSGLFDALYAAL